MHTTPGSTAKQAVDAYVGIGSNLEDRRRHITTAIDEIKDNGHIVVEKVSSIIETDPAGGPAQPRYLNCVVKLSTTLTARDLLGFLQGIETKHARVRTIKNGPRTLDLDILLFGSCRIASLELTIPHPRMFERYFVMDPLREIEPGIDTRIQALLSSTPILPGQ